MLFGHSGRRRNPLPFYFLTLPLRQNGVAVPSTVCGFTAGSRSPLAPRTAPALAIGALKEPLSAAAALLALLPTYPAILNLCSVCFIFLWCGGYFACVFQMFGEQWSRAPLGPGGGS